MDQSIDKFIWRFSRRNQFLIAAVTLLSFPVLYASLELPKMIINDAITGAQDVRVFLGFELGAISYLVMLCCAFLGLVLFLGLVKMRINTMKGSLSERMLRRLRFSLIDRILRFPMQRFSKVSQGELISLVTNETEPLGGYIGDALALPLFQGGTMLTILAFMFVQDPLLGLASIALIPLQGWLIPKLQKKINALGKERVKRVRKLSERIGEMVSGSEAIRQDGVQRYFLAEFSKHLAGIYDIRLQIFQQKFFVKFLNNFINQLTPFFFFLVGGILVIHGDLTIGALAAALTAYKDLTSPWKELLGYYQRRSDAKIKYEQIVEQFGGDDLIPDDFYASHPKRVPGPIQSLKISNLTTLNDMGDKVLDNIRLDIEPGQTIVILGDTAVKRTHIAQCLIGMRQPASGKILLDGVPYSDIKSAEFSARFAYSGPNPFIYNGTIHNNIILSTFQAPQSKDENGFQEEAILSGNSIDLWGPTWQSPDGLQFTDEDALLDWYMKCAQAIESWQIMYDRGILELFHADDYPELAARLLPLRPKMAKAIKEAGLEHCLAPFDINMFNSGLSVGENILFSVTRTPGLSMPALLDYHDFRPTLDQLGVTDIAIHTGVEMAGMITQANASEMTRDDIQARFSHLNEEDYEQLEVIWRNHQRDGLEILTDVQIHRLLTLFLMLVPDVHGPTMLPDTVREKLLEARFAFMKKCDGTRPDGFTYLDSEGWNPSLSIRDNLYFGVEKNPNAREAAKMAAIMRQLLDESESTKYVQLLLAQSQTGIGGARIPMAGHQRIHLGRGLMKKPDVLIINDGWNVFDKESQARMERNVRALLPGITILWLLEETNAFIEADAVYLIEKGRLTRAPEQDMSKFSVIPVAS